MNSRSIKGLQTIGFQTSLETAQNQTFSTESIAGTKRSRPENEISTTFTSARRLLQTEKNHSGPQRAGSYHLTTPNYPNKRRLVASAIRTLPDAILPDDGFATYSQRKAVSSTPGPSQNPLLSLQHPRYGLPASLVANFEVLGVNCIYPWQSSCLIGRGHLTAEKNLVYSAPTGGGKSLVADVLMLKRIIDDPGKKAILVLPYVALVQEKMKWLRQLVEGVNKRVDVHSQTEEKPASRAKSPQSSIRVTGFFGGSKSRATWSDTDIAVCTIEKANMLVNTAIEDCKINELGIVVLDELHMLDDEHRGYLIEIMVSKLMLLQQDIQIVGMSATLSNTELLAKWLHANYYISRYRPIPIQEFLVYEDMVYPVGSSKEFLRTAMALNKSAAAKRGALAARAIDKSTYKELKDPVINAMVSLALETVVSGYGALVFCGSRQACHTNALLISDAMPDEPKSDRNILDKRIDLIASLQSLPCGLDPVLEKSVIKGVAFHHAGLTTEERGLIAEGYDKGILKVLVATCSLAAGINLPARRVILCGARMGRELVGPALLRQMRGRAGRKGKDEIGETFLCCSTEDLEAVLDLLEAEMPAIASSLSPEKRGINRALLEAVATRLVSGREAINDYVRCSLLYHSIEEQKIFAMVDSTLQELTNDKLLNLKADGSYEPTLLGQAIVASAFSPEDGMFIHDELRRGLQAFVMDGEMHIFYMFAPLQSGTNVDIDWPTFRDAMNELDESGLRALQFMGVNPGFVNSMAQGRSIIKDPTLIRIYQRAYTAFQLRDLSNEVPVSAVAQKYHIPRGNVQNLTQICHGFAAGMVKFCQRMGWDMLAVVLDHMRDRLQAGARADLLELAQVTYVKSRTARLLWENGFRTLRVLAEADAKDLVPVLMMGQPRNGKSHHSHSKEAERLSAKLLSKAETIIASANKLWEASLR
ncbi:DEAD-like helicase [Emydomyces testavorans]|uniref:DEAD-like helicase n=1 Tax=Emydomyces testavorans TaxID=2070801 RepID=A0AAF0DKZ6_9EURO|nr:DEAD-like helicase [Emydomyces testavorans]